MHAAAVAAGQHVNEPMDTSGVPMDNASFNAGGYNTMAYPNMQYNPAAPNVVAYEKVPYSSVAGMEPVAFANVAYSSAGPTLMSYAGVSNNPSGSNMITFANNGVGFSGFAQGPIGTMGSAATPSSSSSSMYVPGDLTVETALNICGSAAHKPSSAVDGKKGKRQRNTGKVERVSFGVLIDPV